MDGTEMNELTVGHAWVFEKGIIYGTLSDVLTIRRSKRMRKKLGNLLGVIKCLIPTHPQRVIYEYFQKKDGSTQLRLTGWT